MSTNDYTCREPQPYSLAFFLKQILPFILSVLVGIGSAAITTTVTVARLEERLTVVEKQSSAYSHDTTELRKSISTETSELRKKDNEYERRLSRAEAILENVNDRLIEIGSDVKTLLKRERMQ